MGLPAGGSSGGIVSLRLQTHYHNPQHRSGVADTTDIKVHMTAEGVVRPVEIGSLALGDPLVTLGFRSDRDLPVGWSRYGNFGHLDIILGPFLTKYSHAFP